MMLVNPLKKNKINLSDYDYEKDIEYRKLMAELSVFEVDVLTEIIHGSLQSSIEQICDYLESPLDKLYPALEKLQELKLFTLKNNKIIVSKEMRKYYESQIPKFDDNFRADIEFIKSFLAKVPIHVLPTWYALPRTSDDIFASIIEKFLITPKIYQRYLDEISFDEPVLNSITDDVFSGPNHKISAAFVMDKYQLSRDKFEKYMLYLEFNLICCLSYNQVDDHWKEVITPFHEWREFLSFTHNNFPKGIESPLEVVRTHSHDFGFILDMSVLLKKAIETPLTVKQSNAKFSLPQSISDAIFSRNLPENYSSLLIQMLSTLKLIEIKNDRIIPRNIANAWLEKHLQEQAIAVYRYGAHQGTAIPGGYIDRDLREIEQCLKGLMNKGWIYFSDFIKSCCAPIGDNGPVMLIKKGKRWKYRLPSYSENDKLKIHQYIFQTLFAAGFVATGTHHEKECFSITPFGRMTLD